jgi:signal peptidase II
MQQRDNVGNNIIIPNSTEERKLLVRCMILTGTLLVLDQITKAVIEKYITSPVPVIPHFFDIVKVYNTGAAWGIFAGQRWPLLTISILFFLFSIFYARKLAEGWPERYYSLALVISGIFGNSVDRIWRDGKVVDFLDFYISKYHWPAFNVADSAICVGVGIYMLSSIIRPSSETSVNEIKKSESE